MRKDGSCIHPSQRSHVPLECSGRLQNNMLQGPERRYAFSISVIHQIDTNLGLQSSQKREKCSAHRPITSDIPTTYQYLIAVSEAMCSKTDLLAAFMECGGIIDYRVIPFTDDPKDRVKLAAACRRVLHIESYHVRMVRQIESLTRHIFTAALGSTRSAYFPN